MERTSSTRSREPRDQRSLEARTRTENERFFLLAARPLPRSRGFRSNLDQLNELLAQGWRVTGTACPETADEEATLTGWVVLLQRRDAV